MRCSQACSLLARGPGGRLVLWRSTALSRAASPAPRLPLQRLGPPQHPRFERMGRHLFDPEKLNLPRLSHLETPGCGVLKLFLSALTRTAPKGSAAEISPVRLLCRERLTGLTRPTRREAGGAAQRPGRPPPPVFTLHKGPATQPRGNKDGGRRLPWPEPRPPPRPEPAGQRRAGRAPAPSPPPLHRGAAAAPRGSSMLAPCAAARRGPPPARLCGVHPAPPRALQLGRGVAAPAGRRGEPGPGRMGRPRGRGERAAEEGPRCPPESPAVGAGSLLLLPQRGSGSPHAPERPAPSSCSSSLLPSPPPPLPSPGRRGSGRSGGGPASFPPPPPSPTRHAEERQVRTRPRPRSPAPRERRPRWRRRRRPPRR